MNKIIKNILQLLLPHEFNFSSLSIVLPNKHTRKPKFDLFTNYHCLVIWPDSTVDLESLDPSYPQVVSWFVIHS